MHVDLCIRFLLFIQENMSYIRWNKELTKNIDLYFYGKKRTIIDLLYEFLPENLL